MNFFNIKDLPKKEVKKGMVVCSAFLENVMLTYFEFEPDTEIPSHKHPHEQITFILDGEMEFKLEAEIKILKAGEGVTVAPDKEHSARALSKVRAVDAWNPIRKDYIVFP